MFHELFPCKYSWAYSSSCAQIIVHSNVFLLWQTCSIHVHIYFHHGLHVFTACIFTCSLHVFSACKYQHLCIVYDNWWSMFYELFPYKYSCAYPSSCAQNSVLSTVDRASAFWHIIAAYASLMHHGILWRITLEHCILHLWTIIVW